MVVAVERAGGHGAIFKLEEGGIDAFGRPLGIPDTGHSADAAHQAAADPAHDVQLVRALAKNDAAAEGRVQLFGDPAAVDPVRVVPSVYQPDTPDFAALDDLPHAEDRRLEP